MGLNKEIKQNLIRARKEQVAENEYWQSGSFYGNICGILPFIKKHLTSGQIKILKEEWKEWKKGKDCRAAFFFDDFCWQLADHLI